MAHFIHLTKCRSKKIYHPEYTYKQDAGRGYRQEVSSPKPVKIINAPVIDTLLKSKFVPIAAGGGGIPVVVKDDSLQGVAGVIDKDFSAAKLAEDIQADELVILTTVDNAYVNYNQPDQAPIGKIKIDQLKKYRI